MFAILGVLGLIIMVFVRPQAFLAELSGVPLLHLVLLCALMGIALDLRLRVTRLRITPIVVLALAYVGWALVTVALRNPGALGGAVFNVFVCTSIFLTIGQGVQSFRSLRAVVVLMIGVALFLSVVGIHQGMQPKVCIMQEGFGTEVGVTDGRECEEAGVCYHEGEPGAFYVCERMGLFNVYTINSRVRWLGIVSDPNELAMCISICIPLIIGLYLLRPGAWRAIILGTIAAAILWCNLYTQSRGGQLVFVIANAVYFIRRYGARGAILVALLAAPLLLVSSGRSSDEADESAMVRIEALYVAMTLFVQYPLSGVGYTQFDEYNAHTAHNSYALTGAELGLPGLLIFIALLYFTMKTFVQVTRTYAPEGSARVAVIWAGSLMATQVGLMFGIFFLSFNTSPVLWTFLGICNSFYLAMSNHEPTWEVKLGPRDYAAIGGITAALSTLMFIYTRYKLGGGP